MQTSLKSPSRRSLVSHQFRIVKTYSLSFQLLSLFLLPNFLNIYPRSHISKEKIKQKKGSIYMRSGYFGEMNLGNDKATSGSSSSRKSKKHNSDKPKQPQRGLGVAQLEKIRLHGQMGCNYHPSLPYPHHPTNFIQEDLRVQTAYSSSIPSSSLSYSSPSATAASHGYDPGFMMGLGDYERANIRHDDSQHTYASSWSHGNSTMDAQQYGQPTGMTRHFLNLPVEDSQEKKNKKHRAGSAGSSSQNSEPSDNQDVDLELRLSL